MKTVKIINRTTGETEFVYFGNVTAAMAYYAELKLSLNPKEFRVELGTDGLIRLNGVTMY